MIGAQYFASGVGKLAIGWLSMPQLYLSVYGGWPAAGLPG